MHNRDCVGGARQSEAGISLVETVIIGMVITSVIAIALPSVSTAIRGYNVRSAAAHVAERISAVRALAMAKNKSVTFSYNSGTKTFGFDFTGAEGDGVPDASDPDNPGSSYPVEKLTTGMNVTFPDNADIKVTFNSRGESAYRQLGKERADPKQRQVGHGAGEPARQDLGGVTGERSGDEYDR